MKENFFLLCDEQNDRIGRAFKISASVIKFNHHSNNLTVRTHQSSSKGAFITSHGLMMYFGFQISNCKFPSRLFILTN